LILKVEDIVYIVQVNTSDIRNASTDAKVYIQITGSNFKTEKIVLSKSITHSKPFQRANRDEFELKLPELGEIKRIR
jgi:hypothetical protein